MKPEPHNPSQTRAALVIAHPGHELRVFHWLERKRPTVFVLTDGSGRTGRSRLPSTTSLLDLVHAQQGPIYGNLTDQEVYEAILTRNFESFIAFSRQLAKFLLAKEIDEIAGDAFEGYNPTHDVCRLIIQAAVRQVSQHSGTNVANYDFPLNGNPDTAGGQQDLRFELDDEAFKRKIAAARAYEGLESEVNRTLTNTPVEAFRVECLRFIDRFHIDMTPDTKPYYETHGEKQVEAGFYQNVIRLREHILPLSEALQSSSHFSVGQAS